MKNIILLLLIFVPCALAGGEASTAGEKTLYPALIGGVVKSDTWTVRRTKGEEEFEGHVSYRNSEYKVFADWGLYQRNNGLVRLRGNIDGTKYWKDGSVSRSYADKAQYFLKTNSAQLDTNTGGAVKLYQDDPVRGKWNTLSETAFFDGKSGTVKLDRDVAIIGSSSTAHCATALYDYAAAVFNMQGRPLVTGHSPGYEFAVNGDSATASGFFTAFSVSGKVRGWLRSTTGSPLENGTARALR